MVDQVLPPGAGVTYNIFKEIETAEEEAKEAEVDEDGNPIPQPEKAP
jgi:hypothetical protein